MSVKLEQPIFDTLKYAQQLKSAGIENAEQCAEALTFALRQNVITKNEVEKMLAATLEKTNKEFNKTIQESSDKFMATIKQFADNNHQLDKRLGELTNEIKQEVIAERAALEKSTALLEKAMAEDRARHTEEVLKVELSFQKAMSRNLITTISVLGTLIVVVGSFAGFAQQILKLFQ